MKHNLELWLIRNGDIPDLAASLYNMLGFRYKIHSKYFDKI